MRKILTIALVFVSMIGFAQPYPSRQGNPMQKQIRDDGWQFNSFLGFPRLASSDYFDEHTDIYVDTTEKVIKVVDPGTGISSTLATAITGVFQGTLASARQKAHGFSTVFTTDYGGGLFYYDPLDHSSPDDTGRVFVTTQGDRYKRPYSVVVTPQQWGAKGDSITDDGNAIRSAISKGLTVDMGDSTNRYRITTSITLMPGQVLRGNGAKMITNSAIVMIFPSRSSTIEGISFYGSGLNSGVNQSAIQINGGLGFTDVTKVSIRSCRFYEFGANGLWLRRTVNNHEGNLVLNCIFQSCFVGLNNGDNAEYTNVSNCSFSECNTNILVVGGNILVTGCVISNGNNYNVRVQAGQNDAHGVFAGCLINHAVNFAIKVENINTKDFSFNNCDIYFGIIWLDSCEGVTFNGGTISVPSIYEEGAKNCNFNNVKFYTAPTITANRNGQASKVIYNQCIWPTTIAYNHIYRIGGAYLSMSKESTTTAFATLTTGDTLDFDNTVQSSITANLSYTVDTFYNASGKYFDFTKMVSLSRTMQGHINMVVTVGSSGAFDDTKVEVYLYDIVAGQVIGTFTKGIERGTTSKFRYYSFNGVVPASKVQVRLDNNTAGSINFYKRAAGIPAYCIAQGF